MRIIPCPLDGLETTTDTGEPVYFIGLPDYWLGRHAQREAEAREKLKDAGLPGIVSNFAICMALLDDWNLPGLGSNPEAWDMGVIRLDVMIWVSFYVTNSYNRASNVPKDYWLPSQDGQPQSKAAKV